MYSSFSLNFRIQHERDAIPTSPVLSQDKALAIVENDFRRNVLDYHEAYLHYNYYNFSREKYQEDNEYQDYLRSLGPGWRLSEIKANPMLLSLNLIFVHANGTIYLIDFDTKSFEKVCDRPSIDCVLGRAAEAARDRLVYEVGAIVQGSDSYDSDVHYIIDAETGKVVYHTPYFNPRPLPHRLITINNQTVNELKERIENARFGAVIDIEYNASEIESKGTNAYNPPDVIVILKNTTDAVTITWFNHDIISHTVTSDDGYSNILGEGLDSGTIGPGGDYAYAFIEEGPYQYHCRIHPWMKGSVSIMPNFT
jgi:plastocyanin